jgi:hypothetical protein
VTPLTFHFAVGSSVNVVFTTGGVQTSLSVGDAGGAINAANVVGVASFATETAGGPPALTSLLAFSGAAAAPYNIALTLTSAFAIAGADRVCANVTTNSSVSTPTSDAGAAVGLSDLFDELVGATGTLCFNDAFTPSNPSQAALTLTKNAAPTTTAIASALSVDGGAPSTATFGLTLTGVPATTVFDGHTLNPNASQPITVSGATLATSIQPAGHPVTTVATGATGAFTLTLSPWAAQCANGSCVPAVSVSGNGAFGNVQCGTAAAAQPVTIANGGSAPFSFTAALAKGTAYAISPATGTVAPGTTQTITVTPSVVSNTMPRAIFADTLTVTTTAPGDMPHQVALSETAQGAELTAPINNLTMITAVNTTTMSVVAFTNTGTAPGQPQLMLTGAGASAFAITGTAGGWLAPGATNTSFVVAFSPKAAGTFNATLVISPGMGGCGNSLNLPITGVAQ